MKASTITVILATLVLLFLASYIFFATTKTSLGYEIVDSEQELADLYEIESGYILELADKQSPDHLYGAGEELGLVEIKTSSRYIDTRVPVLGRAGP